MKMNVRGGALVVIGLLLAAATVASAADEHATSTRPPKNLKLVGDHWTPWDPPAAGPDDYIIQGGDTLWARAGEWLGDPYLWPQVWEENKYILDSHWIYPGDPLVRPSKPTVVPESGPPPGVEQKPIAEMRPVADPVPAPAPPPRPARTGPTSVTAPSRLMPFADASDLYCTGAIEPSHEASAVRILGMEMERKKVAEGDVVYISAGRNQGVAAGTRYAVRRDRGAVLHPVSGNVLGDMVLRLGRLRVLAVQDDTSTAVVEMSCEEMGVDDEVAPWQDFAAPMLSALPAFERYDVTPSGGEQGYVVAAKDNITDTGNGHLIYVDLGSAAGLKPGSLVTIFRTVPNLPRLMLGRAVVIATGDGTSTAKIVQSTREIRMGDRVEIYR